MNKLYKKSEIKDTGSISELMLLYLENQKTGYIHSIFNNSLNIQFGENLVHISNGNKGLTSFGCRISEEKIQNLISVCKNNDIVIQKDKKLLFYTLFGIQVIDISEMKKVSLKISEINYSEKKLNEIFSYLKNINFEIKIGIEKDEVIKSLQCGITEKSSKYLTGRGKGLTPAGDDILLGYALIEYLHKKGIKLIYGNYTTDISKQYFDAFNRGYVNEYMFDLFSKDVEEAVLNITKIGHTSGYDLLFGIFLGIKKYRKMEEIK